MKKLYLGIGMVLGAALIGLTGYAATGRPGLTAKVIGEEKAEEIALDDAGVSREDALMQGTMLEYDGGQYVYDVEFASGGTSYDYDILAGDGTIVSSSREALKAPEEKEAEKAAEKKAREEAEEAAEKRAREEAEEERETREKEILALKEAGGFITVDEAKAIALSDAGYEESGVIMEKARFEKADEDDPASYEIEFSAGGLEYEYSVDALTGKILERDMEKEDSEKDDD
ncbi:MAG: PepSY domain-containing protein [Lachnospiraceae bacterium]|nr:PepSY domain-containing protein [Lachnospiraceae bacterium]MBQ3973603.1 PepSY domain-containing protein [Lachnospiraceae bacterium]MBQ4305066.1 PepSY domain-containing protein [Lachnospiraceae bacterium]